MHSAVSHYRTRRFNPVFAGIIALTACILLALVFGLAARGQTPPPADQATQPVATPQAATPASGAITEEEVKQLLTGKVLYLRGGYLDNTLSFDEHGHFIDHSPQGSYTLNLIEIDKVHLSKHKLELEGTRYGLHFLGAMPYEDPTKAVDRVPITPKKKVVRITIDRELVVTPKKKKEKENSKPGKGPAAAPDNGSPGDADEARAEMAAAPEAERPADQKSVTTTASPAHAAQMLRGALDTVFAQGLDARMIATMPACWKLYYRAVDAKADFRPTDPNVLRQVDVDQKAKLLSYIEPASNDYAQANGVAGMALYHVIVGADGKAEEVVVARPIGFGLDENAVEAIRKATFQPAMKDGKAVPVLLDLVVRFRIYSKLTAPDAAPESATQAVLPSHPAPAIMPQP
jgi:TonB family protein